MTGKKRSVGDMQKSNNVTAEIVFHEKSIDLEDSDDEESINNSPHSSEVDDTDDLSDFEWQEPIVNDSETEEDHSGLGKNSDINVNNIKVNEKPNNSESANEVVPRFKQYRSTDRYAESDDSSDEEDLRNTVGNIPMKWYEDFPHIGYNLDGKPILKPIRNQDELDKFLDKMENPDYGRTIYDKTTDRNHILTEEEMQLINRLKGGKFFDGSYEPHEPYIDFFTHEKMIHPVNNFPEHKRSFVPSILEKRKVGKLVHAIKMGWLKPRIPKPEFEERKYYDLWSDVKDERKTHRELARQKMHIPAPKMTLPGHAASYNPAPEYIPNEEEIRQWKEDDPEDRKQDFIPTKHDCLRKVPQYPSFIKERFSRCLDLYLCPRQRRMKINIDPEDLIPKLPKPSDLKPFPTFQTLCYRGHKDMVLTISIDVSGQWLASGSKDGVVRVWEVATARCVREITSLSKTNPIRSLAWCPNASVCLLAVAVGNTVVIVNPSVGDRVIYHSTDKLIESFDQADNAEEEESGEKRKEKSNAIIDKWKILSSGEKFYDGQRVLITHPKDVGKVTWHAKGDYFAATVPENGNSQVFLHQLTRLRSQNPFSRCKGDVQAVLFHPIRPFFFVATKKYVRVYNLTKRELTKKMTASANWISSIAIHPGGDNLIVGAYNSRLSWLDMDLSTKPYQTMVYHKKAVRACCFHRKYPLFASAGDDCSVVVSHGMVYSDLLQNALIVPVKVLKGHQSEGIFGIMDVCFHPHQPWVFSAGGDRTIRLYT